MEKINSFKDLLAWQEGHKLVLMIYEITKFFPKDEMFGLISQMRRAAVSTTSNVAEGFSRQSSKEKIQFYSIAQGSVTEVQNQLVVSRDVGYLDNSQYSDMQTQSIRVHKLTNGLIKYLKKTMLSVLALLLYLIPYTLYLIPSPTHAFTIAKPSNFLALNTGLVGWWTFDGPKMLTNVADSSGQGNNGSLVGQTSTTTVPGKLGQALSFDGVNDYVQLGDMTSLEGSAYATWSFWVKPVYSDYDTVFLSKGASAWHISVPNSGLGAGANKFRVIIAGGSFPVVYTNITATVINNVWQHFTVVYDGTQSTNTTKVKIYKNGVLLTNVDSVGTIPTTLPANATNATIGASSLGVNGTMDDVRIYNRVLSATEITQLYNLGR